MPPSAASTLTPRGPDRTPAHGAVRFHLEAEDEGELELQAIAAPADSKPAAATHTDHHSHPKTVNGHRSTADGLGVKKLTRGRSYSSASELPAGATAAVAPFEPEQCFQSDFLHEPLLQHRGVSSTAAQHLFGTPPPRLHMRWQGITQYVPAPTPADKKARKRILVNVTGRAFCGELVAIMGPSGSGKTSLLTLLSGGWRAAREAGNLDGDILINEQPSTKNMRRFVAMIRQDDCLFSNLTVEQTLRYSALLNLPRQLTREEKLERVERVIELLGLQKCRNTLIGRPGMRGVSGGERKRASVAAEMLSNPSIILADEPTSGLDSTTAARLITTFRSLARGGRSVVCSIQSAHTGDSDMHSRTVFDLFDSQYRPRVWVLRVCEGYLRHFNQFEVVLLAQGRTVFYGSTQQVVAYFGSTGLMCKPFYNPADFVLEIISDLTHEQIDEAEKEDREGTPVKGLQQRAENGMTANGNGTTNGKHSSDEDPKDGIDLEKGVAHAMLKDEMPDRSFDMAAADGGSASDATAEGTIRRLPLLWSRLEERVLTLEDSTRKSQLAEQDRVQEQQASGSPPHSPAHGQALTLTPEEKALADAQLDTEGKSSNRWPLTWTEQFTLLLSRAFLQHKGERVTWLYALQIFGIALVVSLVWFQTPRRVDTLTEQVGSLFFVTIFWSFTPLFNSLTAFPAERDVIIKERAAGSYRLSAYFSAKVCAEAPVELAYPVVFMILVYWMIGYDASAGGFFFSVLTLLLSTLCAQSVGLLISCTLLDFRQSITFASVMMLSLMLLSGFYVKLEQIPVWLRWASYLCFPKYAYSIQAFIQFEGKDMECGDPTKTPPGVVFSSCPVPGDEILDQFQFNAVPLWANIVILAGMAVLFRVLAYLALRKTTQP